MCENNTQKIVLLQLTKNVLLTVTKCSDNIVFVIKVRVFAIATNSLHLQHGVHSLVTTCKTVIGRQTMVEDKIIID